MCALCHQRSAEDELGDLFGPYYVNMRPEGQWPSFLFKKSLKIDSELKGSTMRIMGPLFLTQLTTF
ncbi:hypothetical protein OESDEN_04857 [Oesophagostomum dentatum]|uniref:Uncharacterized protein n=1 Tax=Oesophagostomum dentatum TaxID=61180 RepID=A0A0B1TCE2_OESDE|nr:hypothetical protein OESDEN_04857 [Oesophagostomum dentatum]